MNTCFLSVLYQ